MMTAHVNSVAIALRFSFVDNLSRQQWEMLLDELRSEHIPSLYQKGKRMLVSIESEDRTKAVIYLTERTVTMDQAIDILHRHGIEVHDARTQDDPSEGH